MLISVGVYVGVGGGSSKCKGPEVGVPQQQRASVTESD